MTPPLPLTLSNCSATETPAVFCWSSAFQLSSFFAQWLLQAENVKCHEHGTAAKLQNAFVSCVEKKEHRKPFIHRVVGALLLLPTANMISVLSKGPKSLATDPPTMEKFKILLWGTGASTAAFFFLQPCRLLPGASTALSPTQFQSVSV